MHPFDSPFSMRRAGRMAIAPVLKTGVRKGMGVRIPRSPPLTVEIFPRLIIKQPERQDVPAQCARALMPHHSALASLVPMPARS